MIANKSKFKHVLVGVVFLYALTIELVHAVEDKFYIVGGTAVESKTAYPFMVSVYLDARSSNDFNPRCGGVLIASRWVLTVAHCVYNTDYDRAMNPANVGVLLGQTDLTKKDGFFVGVTRVIIHPNYDDSKSLRDIALIELQDDYPASQVELPSSNSQVPVLGESGTVLGWGALQEDGRASNKLQKIDLPVLSHSECFRSYADQFNSKFQFCAGGARAGGQDACQGDSGGPLLVQRDGRHVVAGLVSYGDGCGQKGVPGVYTRVEAFSEWIDFYTNDTIKYQGPGTVADEFENVPVVEVNSEISQSVAKGEALYFSVPMGGQINLASCTGDADLFIIENDSSFSLSQETVMCFSNEPPSLDVCVIEEFSSESVAIVYGYSNATFTLSSQGVKGKSEFVNNCASSANTNRQIGWSIGLGSIGNISLLILFAFYFRVKSRRIFEKRS